MDRELLNRSLTIRPRWGFRVEPAGPGLWFITVKNTGDLAASFQILELSAKDRDQETYVTELELELTSKGSKSAYLNSGEELRFLLTLRLEDGEGTRKLNSESTALTISYLTSGASKEVSFILPLKDSLDVQNRWG